MHKNIFYINFSWYNRAVFLKLSSLRGMNMSLDSNQDLPTIKNKSQAQKLLSVAGLAGTIILENGGEVYRAEDTVTRICESRKNIRNVDVFSTPTAIFVSLNFQGEIITNLRRTKISSI